jgi:hypothetical protein
VPAVREVFLCYQHSLKVSLGFSIVNGVNQDFFLAFRLVRRSIIAEQRSFRAKTVITIKLGVIIT